MSIFATIRDPRLVERPPLGTLQLPRISVAAYCEMPETADAVTMAAADRRMMRARLEIESGGLRAAVARYRDAPSPDLIVFERQVPGDLLLEELEKLAEVCDAGTKVIVVGASNDVRLYRELLGRGISDYLVAPVDAPALLTAIAHLYDRPDAKRLGRTYAFVGAKGGVGSSTVAHNVASTIAREFEHDVIIADLDLPFGTVGLDFNVDTAQGMSEALGSTDRLDELLLERLLGKCGDRLNMLAAPLALDRSYDFAEEDLDELVRVAKTSAAHVVLDVPHLWTSWARHLLLAADEVIVTAAPDLANLRNAKSLVEVLRKARQHDAPPCLVLNQVGVPKRPEIKGAEFTKALQLELAASIPFDPKLFGTAANHGRMVSDVAARSAAPFSTLARMMLARGGAVGKSRRSRGLFSLLAARKRST